MFTEKSFITAVEKSFQMYKKYKARSTAKLKPIHWYIATVLNSIWGTDFEIHCLGNNAKKYPDLEEIRKQYLGDKPKNIRLREKEVSGKYYPKSVDIAITHCNKPVFCLGIKFVTSNYKQNANNYFENMMGETANIQALGDLPYAHLIILRHETPYYEKNETEKPSKIEIINDKDIQKYLHLIFDSRQAHRPDFIGIQVINLDESTGKVCPTNVEKEKSFSENVAVVKLLKEKLALTHFFNEIEQYKNYCLSKNNG